MAEATATPTAAKTKPAKLPQVKNGVTLEICGTISKTQSWPNSTKVPGDTGDSYVVRVASNGSDDPVNVPKSMHQYYVAAQKMAGVAVRIRATRLGNSKYSDLILQSMELVEFVQEKREFDMSEFDQLLNS